MFKIANKYNNKILRIEKKLASYKFKNILFRLRLFFIRKNTNSSRVFIYSPGKTGTSSVHTTLSNFYFKKFDKEIRRDSRAKVKKNVLKSHQIFPPLANETEKYKNIYFVQFREPISRTLSDLNENSLDKIFDENNELILKNLNYEFTKSLNSYFNWWNKFFIDFKINDYFSSIQKHGFAIINLDKKNIMVFQLTEDLNNTFTRIVNKIFDTKLNYNILSSVRITKSFLLKNEIEKVKKQKFDISFLKEVYKNKYVNQLYSDDQLNIFIDKFTNK